jgi:plastocyanin
MVFLARFTGLAAGALLFTASNVLAAQTYTVLVGYEDLALGFNINKYVPEVLQIHAGDTVVFKANSHDSHTVTFYKPGSPLPDFFINGFEADPKAIFPMPNPLPQPYNGSYFAGSGLMTLNPSPITVSSWAVTFSHVGQFNFACSIHGMMQNGSIIVVPDATEVLSPKEVKVAANKWKAMVDRTKIKLYKNAVRTFKRVIDNDDGTKTYYIKMGLVEGDYDFHTFFPRTVTAKPNDKIIWYGATFHTITFLNGQDLPAIIAPIGDKLVLNPVLYTPAGGNVIKKTGFINMGLYVDPRLEAVMTVDSNLAPGTKLDYVCLIHVTSNMKGSIKIANKKKHRG